MNVAVVYSLPSKRLLNTKYGATDEDSGVIAEKVVIALKALGMDTTVYAIEEDKIGSIENIQTDLIFNLIEWSGLDIHLSERAFQCFRKLNVPVTGSNEEMFVLTGDKIRLKQALQKAKISVPKAAFFETGKEDISSDLPYPLIVKPSLEHCSVGLGYDAIAHDKDELRPIVKRQIQDFGQSVLAEEFVVGRELLVYLLEEKDQVRVLPIEEILFDGSNPLVFQTYESKWGGANPGEESSDVASDVLVAKLSAVERKAVEDECIKAFKELRLRGYARLDVRLRDGIPYILEANANSSVYDGEDDLQNPNDEVIFGIKFIDYIRAIVDSAKYHFDRGEKI
jgi:D-alanine-D-alanine ligase